MKHSIKYISLIIVVLVVSLAAKGQTTQTISSKKYLNLVKHIKSLNSKVGRQELLTINQKTSQARDIKELRMLIESGASGSESGSAFPVIFSFLVALGAGAGFFFFNKHMNAKYDALAKKVSESTAEKVDEAKNALEEQYLKELSELSLSFNNDIDSVSVEAEKAVLELTAKLEKTELSLKETINDLNFASMLAVKEIVAEQNIKSEKSVEAGEQRFKAVEGSVAEIQENILSKVDDKVKLLVTIQEQKLNEAIQPANDSIVAIGQCLAGFPSEIEDQCSNISKELSERFKAELAEAKSAQEADVEHLTESLQTEVNGLLDKKLAEQVELVESLKTSTLNKLEEELAEVVCSVDDKVVATEQRISEALKELQSKTQVSDDAVAGLVKQFELHSVNTEALILESVVDADFKLQSMLDEKLKDYSSVGQINSKLNEELVSLSKEFTDKVSEVSSAIHSDISSKISEFESSVEFLTEAVLTIESEVAEAKEHVAVQPADVEYKEIELSAEKEEFVESVASVQEDVHAGKSDELDFFSMTFNSSAEESQVPVDSALIDEAVEMQIVDPTIENEVIEELACVVEVDSSSLLVATDIEDQNDIDLVVEKIDDFVVEAEEVLNVPVSQETECCESVEESLLDLEVIEPAEEVTVSVDEALAAPDVVDQNCSELSEKISTDEAGKSDKTESNNIQHQPRNKKRKNQNRNKKFNSQRSYSSAFDNNNALADALDSAFSGLD